jgi:hypothetical protein
MHSPPSKRPRGDPDEEEDPVQNTLEAFDGNEHEVEPEGGGGHDGDASEGPLRGQKGKAPRQQSIDTFIDRSEGKGSGVQSSQKSAVPKPSRALEGIALEMCMERVAIEESARGIVRDELLITIARECEMPLENLDLVDSYIADLELEGKLHRVGDMVVLARDGDGDLLSQNLSTEEFMEQYKRRYRSKPRRSGR